MCMNREHRWRIQVRVGVKPEIDLVVYAKSLTEAMSKADGWVHEKYPGQTVYLGIFRMGYSSDQVAEAHHAKLSTLEDLFRSKGLPVESLENVIQQLVEAL